MPAETPTAATAAEAVVINAVEEGCSDTVCSVSGCASAVTMKWKGSDAPLFPTSSSA